MALADTGSRVKPQGASPFAFLYQRETRQVLYQAVLGIAIVALFYMMVSNASENLRKQNIASGFDFLGRTAGFDISQSLIDYTNTQSYGRAFLVGFWNTILIAVIGIFFATILGFVAGIARLSSNWLVAKVAAAYVEFVRNCPLLLQLFFWYFGVLKALPGVFKTGPDGAPLLAADGTRIPGSFELPGGLLLNNRGLIVPQPEWLPGFGIVLGGIVFGILASMLVAWWANRRQMATGQRFPVLWSTIALVVLLPLGLFLAMGRPLNLEYPVLGRFNLSGGIVVVPEFVAMLVGLVFYTASYIAEIVRAGILGVSKGQKEAALAIGLTKGQALRLVVIPQAMRIIIPPLTSNYLNLTKNSSLGVAIGYPDLVNVGGTVLNQTGQAVELILMIMGVYLTTSLLTSAFMNWFNTRMALVER